MQPADLLLGRKTFEIWETYWPRHADSWPGINDVKKYVLSNTIESSDWSHSVFLKHVDDIRKLKNTSGSDIKVWGSSQLVQLLLENGLVDEFWLMIHPIVLGKGKKLFSETAIPAAFTLVRHLVTSTGVIFANYRQEGGVVTGNAGE